MQVQCGTQIEGFEILALLGVGGMGSVYKARQVDLNRFVALKFLDWKSSADDSVEAVARFKREAQALSTLRHKNIVSVYSAHHSDKYGPFLVMEFLRGQSLQDLLSKNVPMEPELAIKTAIQILEGLAHAHAHGIVHRDIKPNNIIMGEPYGLKIIDFGLVKLLPDYEKERQTLTEAGFAIGSVLYMSPEQCRGQAADERSDIYAVGCVLHHCLTGLPPFTGEHSVVVMNQHLSQLLPALSAVCPERTYPEKLQDVLLRATAKEATDRYQSASAMIEDLQALAAGEPDYVKTAYFAAPTVGSLDSKQPGKVKTRRKKTTVIGVLATLLALILVGVGSYVWSSEDQSRKVCQALAPYLQPGDAANLASFCESHNNKAAAEVLRQHVLETMNKQDAIRWADEGIALMLTQQANDNSDGARTTFDTVDSYLSGAIRNFSHDGNYEAAAQYAEQLIKLRQAYRHDDPLICAAMNDYANILADGHRFAEAETAFQQYFKVARSSADLDKRTRILARCRLAMMLSKHDLNAANRQLSDLLNDCMNTSDLSEDDLDCVETAICVVSDNPSSEAALSKWLIECPHVLDRCHIPALTKARYEIQTRTFLAQALTKRNNRPQAKAELNRILQLCEKTEVLAFGSHPNLREQLAYALRYYGKTSADYEDGAQLFNGYANSSDLAMKICGYAAMASLCEKYKMQSEAARFHALSDTASTEIKGIGRKRAKLAGL